jgi:3-methyladenine DNA glycosylase AlkD
MSEPILRQLFALQDEAYRLFQTKLMPTVPPEQVIGVRIPALRKLAKELWGTPEAQQFMENLPHKYYEENNLHGLFIQRMGDYDQVIQALNRFLPFVDNWATCDLLRSKVVGKHLPEFLFHIRRWIASEETYTVRFGIEMLMTWYLDRAFQPEYLDWVAAVPGEDYYIRMMVAWFFATALAKQPKATLPILEEKRLPAWTHNKAIQKAIESRQIPTEQKNYLKTLKIKEMIKIGDTP